MAEPIAGIEPDWPAPGNVRAFFSERSGGFSEAPFASLNMAMHVGDDPMVVQQNRESIHLPSEPVWLEQIHSNICIDVDQTDNRVGDGSVTRKSGTVLAMMVADCLPVLFTSADGRSVAIAHAGWRGLADGVLASTVAALGQDSLLAWMGPAIGPCHYTVGEDVRGKFTSETGFRPDGGQYSMDLYSIAKAQLQSLGVAVFGGGYCTYCDVSRYFSYRRDGVTGRMAGFIWKV